MKLTNIQRMMTPESLSRLSSQLDPAPVATQARPWINDLARLFQEEDGGNMTEKTINAALDKVQAIEGGLVNDPVDPGGLTNRGVTLKFLQSVRPEATEKDLRALTAEDARGLFRQEFVDKVGIDRLPDRVQAEAIGLAINAGPARAIRVLQAAAGAKDDGKVGPKTIEALKGLTDAQVKAAVDDYYISLVERKPELSKFLRGWLNRSASLASVPEDTNA